MWYMIEGFNGYEINEDGDVRSMKMMNADPGHLMKLYDGDYYILSNNQNKPTRVYRRDLLKLVFHSGKELHPRGDNHVYLGSRNKHFYFDKGINPSTEQEKSLIMDFSKLIINDED